MSATHHLEGISSHGETISGLNFSIMYFNCRSMLPKFDEVVATCSASHPDIVCLVETWLSVDILDSEVFIPNYSVVRLDRNRHGGGVLVYVHSSIT